MQHPIPSGTRDVLPDEMRELRALTETLRATLDARGYGEIYTPALEYEAVLARGVPDAAAPAYRLFDEHGELLVLRSDMTIPIARVVANRYANAEPPLRFCYFAHTYRAVKPHLGQAREMLQAGIELIGSPAPDGTAEAIEVLVAVLDAVGLEQYKIGVGDASLFPALLEQHGIGEERRSRILHELVTRDFVGLRRELEAAGAPELLAVAQRRGGVEVIGDAPGLGALHERLSGGARERVIYDLGLTRDLGYYTGAVFEVYDAALGASLGGGGRYDELLGRFTRSGEGEPEAGGRDLPAVGWALGVERLHRAVVGERG